MSRARLAASQSTVADALRCYFLLSDRLRRPAFKNAIDDIDTGIRSDVRHSSFYPSIGITEQESHFAFSLSEAPSSYFNGC